MNDLRIENLVFDGISIGHRDTDNLITGNTIRDNTFTKTRGGKKRDLVKQGPETKQIVVEGSKTKGL